MGGDDLGSDDEHFYASDTSASGDHTVMKDVAAEPLDVALVGNKRKPAEGSKVSPKKKRLKSDSEESKVDDISRQSASQQAAFMSSAIAKYLTTLDQQSATKSLELKPVHFAVSKKDNLLLRITDIVAQNKIRKWKTKLSPCVIVVCVSARRAVQVLKELAPIKSRAAKLFPKSGSIAEQLQELADAPFSIAVGTPHRLQALCKGEDSTKLTLSHTQLVVFDLHLTNKQYSVLTLPDTASSCMSLLIDAIIPSLQERKDIRLALF